MRIYAIADFHGKRVRMPIIERMVAEYRPDIVVLAGDVTRRGRPQALLEDLNGLQRPVLVVHGNSDPAALGAILEPYANLSN